MRFQTFDRGLVIRWLTSSTFCMARIEIYARLRPTERRFEGLITTSPNDISVQIGRQREDGAVERFSKAAGTRHNFRFSRTFDEEATQPEIFDAVARKIVDRFADGYNGTVFAYGQTSTGKTYTIEGDARQDDGRGLIPRTLSYLYTLVEEKKMAFLKQAISQIDQKNDSSSAHHREISSRSRSASSRSEREMPGVRVHVSYMEIYQDTGYDLLNPGARPGSLMLSLPKVQISETPDGRVVVRDLSLHEAPTEQVALDLLKKGSACRKVAETAMNQSSSRSHSIFTITMTTKQPGSEVILRSKLHLVDLAGSERVYKTGSGGRVLQEAKYINLSLHHLEHVIVSLQQQSRAGDERRRGHIPYRNSMLTMVLRDSLGGNCLTAMIATVSAEKENIMETISTLRFSQRVACVSNTARPNEELDDKAVIKKLKKRVSELEKELISIRENKTLPPQMSVIDSGRVEMSESQRQLCHHVLHDFFHGKVANPVEAGINTPALFQECLQVLRGIVIDAVKSKMTTSNASTTSPLPAPTSHYQKNSSSSEQSSVVEKNERSDARASWENKRSNADESRDKRVRHTTAAEAIAEGRSRSRRKKRRSQGKHAQPQDHQIQEKEQGTSHFETPPRPRREFLRTPPTATEHSLTCNPLSLSAGKPCSVSGQTSNSHHQSQRPSFTPSPNSQLHPFTPPYSPSPTPQSRQSSGIGSLQEYDEFHHQEQQQQLYVRHKQQQQQQQQQNMALSGSANTQPVAWAKRVHQPYATVSPDNTHKSPNKAHLSPNKAYQSPNKAHQSPNKAHQSPNMGKPSLFGGEDEFSATHQFQSQNPVPITPEARMMQQLQKEAEKLQRSREKKEQLSCDVQLLSLRVQEEDLRTKLEGVGEQLASQHARILASQKTEGSDLESERLVEQQLRIKQARLHQKFLGVQQQIRSLQTSPQIPKSKPLPINPSSPLRSPPSANKPNIAVMINQVARCEVRNAKVKNEIDLLRETQVEKELQLKEAATRRKMQELKKQLLNSTTSPSSPPQPSPQSSAVSGQHTKLAILEEAYISPKSTPHSQSAVSQSPIRVNPCQSPQITCKPPQAFSQSPRFGLKSQLESSDSQRSSLCSQPTATPQSPQSYSPTATPQSPSTTSYLPAATPQSRSLTSQSYPPAGTPQSRSLTSQSYPKTATPQSPSPSSQSYPLAATPQSRSLTSQSYPPAGTPQSRSLTSQSYPKTATPQSPSPSSQSYPLAATPQSHSLTSQSYPPAGTPQSRSLTSQSYPKTATPQSPSPSSQSYPLAATPQSHSLTSQSYPPAGTPQSRSLTSQSYPKTATPQSPSPSSQSYPLAATPQSHSLTSQSYPPAATPQSPSPSSQSYPLAATPQQPKVRNTSLSPVRVALKHPNDCGDTQWIGSLRTRDIEATVQKKNAEISVKGNKSVGNKTTVHSTTNINVDLHATPTQSVPLNQKPTVSNRLTKSSDFPTPGRRERDMKETATLVDGPRFSSKESGCVVKDVGRQRKDRVLRIRRCVAAVTTIQRAWRRHRLGHMTLT